MIMNWRIYIALSNNEVLGKPVYIYRLVRAAYTRLYTDCGFHYAEGWIRKLLLISL